MEVRIEILAAHMAQISHFEQKSGQIFESLDQLVEMDVIFLVDVVASIFEVILRKLM